MHIGGDAFLRRIKTFRRGTGQDGRTSDDNRAHEPQDTFARLFPLSGIDEVQPAETYTVETDEELLPGLSFLAYRRIATLIFLPSRPGGAFLEQVVNIDPLELEAAGKGDASIGS